MYTPTKTLQEAFDLMLSTMRAQNWARSVRNIDGDVVCAYRGDGGLKCAAGALISDASAAIADAGDEYGSWSVLACDFRPLLEEQGWPISSEAISMYRAFQRIHDEGYVYIDGGYLNYFDLSDPEIRAIKERRCADLAHDYQLRYTPPA